MPYISASIIFQLLTVVIPAIGKLAKEGEAGRKKIVRYTRYGTVVISAIQSFGIAAGLEGMAGGAFVQNPGWSFRITHNDYPDIRHGFYYVAWRADYRKGHRKRNIADHFCRYCCKISQCDNKYRQVVQAGELSIFFVIFLVVMMVAVIGAIIYMERGQRKIPVQYAKRVVGRKVYGGQATHLPLKINTSGVIPPIFASSIIMFPATVAGFIAVPWVQAISETALSRDCALYDALCGNDIFLCLFLYCYYF